MQNRLARRSNSLTGCLSVALEGGLGEDDWEDLEEEEGEEEEMEEDRLTRRETRCARSIITSRRVQLAQSLCPRRHSYRPPDWWLDQVPRGSTARDERYL